MMLILRTEIIIQECSFSEIHSGIRIELSRYAYMLYESEGPGLPLLNIASVISIWNHSHSP